MKNKVLFCCLAIILISGFLLFRPAPVAIVLGIIIAFGKVGVSIAMFHEDLKRTRFVFSVIIFILTILTAVSTLYFIITYNIKLGTGSQHAVTIANEKALGWIIFFSVIVLNAHFLYVWFFTKPNRQLQGM